CFLAYMMPRPRSRGKSGWGVPFHLTRAGAERLERSTAGFGDQCSTKLSYTPPGSHLSAGEGRPASGTGQRAAPTSPFADGAVILLLPRLLVNGMFALLAAELFQLEPVLPAGLLLGAVVPGAADGALEPDVFSHDFVPCPW